jgi:hypothetical protein
MWYLVYISLGVAALGLFTKKGRNVVKIAQIFYETTQNNIKNPRVTPTFELINLAPVVKYGELYLNASSTFFHYDVICFTSNSFPLDMKEKHNYNPTHEICERIPITLIRSGANLSSIPFRPSDFKYNRLYVAIKRISSEDYSIYRFENKEYINALDIIETFEKDMIANSQKEVCLAEAYD